jgi:hypothetical protein
MALVRYRITTRYNCEITAGGNNINKLKRKNQEKERETNANNGQIHKSHHGCNILGLEATNREDIALHSCVENIGNFCAFK